MTGRIGRRATLAGAGAMTALALAAGKPDGRRSEQDVDGAALRDRLIRLFGSLSGALAIGSAYLAFRPDEASREALMEALVPFCRNSDALRDTIRAAIRDDFERGATVKLDGWVLSVTEARICALAVVA